MHSPLENIVVLDLTRVLAGPYCTMLLSDLGAEVIKVELPETGDDSRLFGPFKNNKSLYFLSINRGKKSISLNLKSPRGKEIFEDLVKKVDILVENYRPGTMEKLDLSYEKLNKINPRLIYAAASGFGHTGPDSCKPAYDILAQALSGMMSITGWANTPPTRVGASIGDISASLFATIGINAALYQREKTGLGQKIDVAMLDSQVAMLENAIVRYQVDGVSPAPIGNRHPTITPFQAFKTKDKYIVIPVGNDSLWEKFCMTIQRPDLIKDERFDTNNKRTQNIDTLIPMLEEIVQTKDSAEWLSLLEKAGIPCGAINSIDDIMKNEQLISRNMFIEVNDKEVGTIKIAGNPIKMSTLEDPHSRKSAPDIGEHNLEIYSRFLGLSAAEIEQLKKTGVI